MSHNARQRGVAWVERLLFAIGALCLAYYGYMTIEARQFQREQSAAFAAMLEERARAQAVDAAAPSAVADAMVTKATDTRAALPADEIAATSTGVTRAAVRMPSGEPIARNAMTDARVTDKAGASRARHAPSAGRTTLAAPGVIALLEIPRLKLSTPVMSGDDAATLNVAVGHLPDTPKPWEPGNSALAAHRDGLFRPLRNIRIGDDVRVRTLEGDFVYRVRETRVVAPTDLSVLAPTDQPTLTLITCYPFNFVGSAPQRFIVHAERVPPAAVTP